MKAHLAKVSLALLSTVFLLGCQEQGSGPVGPEGPQFNKPGALSEVDCLKLGKVFDAGHCHDDDVSNPADEPLLYGDVGFTCDDGANMSGSTSGQVIWENIRRKGTFHIHAMVQLRGASTNTTYNIFGNQDVLCDMSIVDFALRFPGHVKTITTDANGDGDARIGLSFGGGDQGEELTDAGHAPGVHKLWLTLREVGGDEVLRSRAFGVQIKDHKGGH